jgi:hypothetical protein
MAYCTSDRKDMRNTLAREERMWDTVREERMLGTAGRDMVGD